MEEVQTPTAFKDVPGAHIAYCRCSLWDKGNSQEPLLSVSIIKVVKGTSLCCFAGMLPKILSCEMNEANATCSR